MKKFSFFLLCLAVIFSVSIAKAQTVSTWDGTAAIWTHGNGTQADPYLIESAQNLAWIAEMVNGGVTTYADVWFKLTTDLNMNNIAWVPIGNSTTNLFRGKFNGDSHLINNISISTGTYRGLFGITGDGFRCENLGVKTDISSLNGGGIVGSINGSNTVISNCYNTGTNGGIVGENRAAGTQIISCYNTSGGNRGGIVYRNYSSLTIKNCYNSGNAEWGGIVAENRASLTIINCYNSGNISNYGIAATGYNANLDAIDFAGGIVGWSTSSLNIYNSYNVGNITANKLSYNSSSSYKVESYAGGIVGYSNSTLKINKCYNKGTVSSTVHTSFSDDTRNTYSGGIVGFGGTQIVNCYNRGEVKAYAHYSTSNVVNGFRYSGGICGKTSATIINCYNTGTLTGGTLGTIRAHSSSGTVITNCYYLSTCGATSGGGTSKTEAEMKSASFPILLNADSTVYVMDGIPNINDGYPVFGSVSSRAATQITFSKANIHGVYDIYADVVGFQYKKTSESDYTTVYTNVGTPASYQLSNLQSGTQYTFRFFVQKDGVTYNGQALTFTTLACDLQASITKSATAICQGDTATFTVAGISTYSNAFTYEWGNGSTDTSIIVTNDAFYSVTVHDTNGCSASVSASITVNPVPQGNISGNTILCSGQSTTLTASGANSYHWSTGATAPVITVNTSGDYTCTFTNSHGCTDTQTVTVNVFSEPIITGNTTLCDGGSTTLTAMGGDSYQWSTGATTASINIDTAGTYSVTASTSNGCSGSASVTVIQNEASNVTISGNTVICSGIGTSLTASSGTDYLWSTGETTQSISVNTPGNYSVTVTDNNGCNGSSSQTVTMMEPAVISGSTQICQGQSTSLSASGSGNYAWDNGASTSFITVNTPGNYTVTVTLPNGCSSSATVNVSVGTTPTPVILGNTTLCQGQSTTLTANGGSSYVWDNGNTSNSITVSQSGVYTVTATNAEGCSATANVTVTVNPLPNVNISGNSSFCQDDNVTLTATGASTYMWSNSQSGNTITVSVAGNYTVTGTDANGCSNTATKTVSVNPTYNIPLTHSICQGEIYNFYGQNLTTAGTYTHTLQTVNGCDSVLTLTLTVKNLPTPSITGNTTLCEGETTTLIANGGTSYLWSDASTSNSISVSQSGIYTVTATNAEGCSNTANVTVTVNPLPTVTITGNSTICQGSSTTLMATGANTYSWSTGENTASVSINAFGIYTVTGTSIEGCSSTANVTVLVSQLPVITITGETDICAGESTTLTANGGETYLWSNGTTDNTLTVNMAGTYQVIGYNAAGCSSMADAIVNVWQPATSEFTVECPDPCYEWNGESYCQSGDYTQTLQTVHGCDSVVTLHLTITVGIEDHDFAASMTVYPNPTNGIVNIQFTDNNSPITQIHVFDIYGKLLGVVETQNFASLQTAQIDLSRYANGVYFIKAVMDGKTIAVRKVVKQ